MTLIVSNLDSCVQHAYLIRLFESYGTVNSVYNTNAHQLSVPHESCLVDMPNEHEAQLAMEQLNGSVLCNRHMNVQKVSGKDKAMNGYQKQFEVEVQQEDASATYKVNKYVDGKYIAQLLNPARGNWFKYPAKLVLHKVSGIWMSDHCNQFIAKVIGDHIDSSTSL